ncbi:CvpA family protein [Gracilibacillus sp. JCM 18860]|uniref:CvpA family protein n=1 Tax=Gracilibacillus sp. JCM 18860 TaxID=1306159 RepID=UPI0006D03EB5
MVTFVILILLLLGFLVGLKRGFILQLLHLTSFILAFIVAVMYYKDLAGILELWIPYPELSDDGTWAVFLDTFPLEAAFYNAIAFGLLFFATKIVLQIIATMLDFVADLPILSIFNSWLGAILGFIEVYLVIFVVLYIIALAPVTEIQAWIDQSSLATYMIEDTPVLSEKLKDIWFSNDPTS